MKELHKVRIGDICNVRTGKLNANASSPTGAYPFFTCSREALRIDHYAYDCECVLIAGNGELNAKYYNGKFNAYQRTYIISLKPSIDDVSVKYLFFFFSSYIETLRVNSIGGIIKYIKLGDITDAFVPLPSIEEQNHIVSELELITKVIEKKKSQIQDFDLLSKSFFNEMFGDPSINDKGWPMVKFGSLVKDNYVGLSRGAKEQGSDRQFIYFKMNNISPNGFVDLSKLVRIDASVVEQSKYEIHYGDFLFNTRNSYELVGKACVFNIRPQEPYLFNNNVLRITFKDLIDPFFLSVLFKDRFIAEQLNGIKKGTTNVCAIYYRDLASINVILPNLELQYKYREIFESIEFKKAAIKRSLKEINAMYENQIHQWF